MNSDEALRFLRNHQPMPDDVALTEELITGYDEVRRFFANNPDERCIPLFLNSFGRGDGFGVYQLVEDVFKRYPSQTVAPHLSAALLSPNRATQYWAAEISASFPCDQLVGPLSKLLDNADEDLVTAAVIALGQIRHPDAISALKAIYGRSPTMHLRSLIQEQLGSTGEE